MSQQYIKAIETEYNGYKFRSRAEARWALFFDTLGIKYEYEVEGLQFSDGTRYLPDFYLPESDSFFEVKGLMTDYDLHKIKTLISEFGKSCTIGYPDMSFETCDDWWGEGYELTDKESSHLVECTVCGKKYFAGANGWYKCQCCGEYDGDHYFFTVCDGELKYPEPQVKDAIKIARQARFEKWCALKCDNKIPNSTEKRKPKKFDLENYSCYGKIESKTRDDERLQKHRQDSRGERG